MKTDFRVLLILAVYLLHSCASEDSTKGKNSSCNLLEYTPTYTYQYDETTNKLTKAVFGTENYYIYNYGATQVDVKSYYIPTGEVENNLTITILSSLITKIKTNGYETNYFYNSDGTLKYFVRSNGDSSILIYDSNRRNVIEAKTYYNKVLEADYVFEYDNKNNPYHNDLLKLLLVRKNLVLTASLFNSNNLIKSTDIAGTNKTSFVYEYNSDGYPTAITATSNLSDLAINGTIRYNCK